MRLKIVGPIIHEGIPRDFYVTREHVEKYGYTTKCPRCRVLIRGGKPTQSHSKVCRERIRKFILEDPEEAELLRKIEEKRDESIAKEN